MPRSRSGSRAVLTGSVGAFRRHVSAAALFLCGHQAGEALVPVLVGVIIDQAITTGDPTGLLFWLAVLALDFAMLSFSYRFGAAPGVAGHDPRRSTPAAEGRRPRCSTPAAAPRPAGCPARWPAIATSDAKRVGMLNFAVPLAIAALAALVVGGGVAAADLGAARAARPARHAARCSAWCTCSGKPLERRSGPEQERAAHASGVAADLVAGLRVLKGIGAEPAAVAATRDQPRRARRHAAGHRCAGLVRRRRAGGERAVPRRSSRWSAGGSPPRARSASAGWSRPSGWPSSSSARCRIFGWVNGRVRTGPRVRRPDRRGARRAARRASTARALPAHGPRRAGVRGLHHGRAERARPRRRSRGAARRGGRGPGRRASALLRCLGREVDPATGDVELDGVPLADYPPAAAQGACSWPRTTPICSRAPLRDNVRGRGAGRSGRRRPAMAAAQADQVAEALPDGPDTPVAEQGRSLSGGQRQRVALARALAADAPVLVLHDPTTAVDPVTEARIAAGLRELRRGRTTVLVTTSPALLAVTDRVVVLDDGGSIADAGTHADLLAPTPATASWCWRERLDREHRRTCCPSPPAARIRAALGGCCARTGAPSRLSRCGRWWPGPPSSLLTAPLLGRIVDLVAAAQPRPTRSPGRCCCWSCVAVGQGLLAVLGVVLGRPGRREHARRSCASGSSTARWRCRWNGSRRPARAT